MLIKMTELIIEVDLKKVYAQLNDFKNEFKTSAVLKNVGLRNLKWINDNFKNEGLEYGGWLPLQAKTIARRRGSTYKILQDTGRLRQSFDNYGIKGIKIGPDWFELGSKVVYAATHNYGDDNRGIPQRRMLPSNEIASNISVNLLKAILDQLRKKHG